MDKHLHIHILEVLQQNNAIGRMVDIKPAFADELNTQEGRKNFKTQLDYLVNENLIEASSKFEFLTWELLTGLYPIENKKIEARLTGNWHTYLSKRGASRNDPSLILPPPVPTPPPAPKIKPGIYEAPATVLPYPGANANKTEAAPLPLKPTNKVDDDFEPFKVKTAPAPTPHPDADKFLKEEDFLPFKVRNARKAQTQPDQPPISQDEPILISKNPAPHKPEPLKAAAQEPFFTPPPVPQVTGPIKPDNTETSPAPKPEEEKPAIKQPEPVKQEEEEEEIFFTSRWAKPTMPVPQNPELKPFTAPVQASYTAPKNDEIKPAANKPEPLKVPAEEPFFTPPPAYTPPPAPQSTEPKPLTAVTQPEHTAPKAEQATPVTVTPEPEKAPAQQIFFTPPSATITPSSNEPKPFTAATQASYTAPKTAEAKPAPVEPEFTEAKTTYTPPKSEPQDIAVTVKPFAPVDNATAGEEKPLRIHATVKRKTEADDEAPIFTARAARRHSAEAVQQQPVPEQEPEQQPVIPEAPSLNVINLRTSAAAYQDTRKPVAKTAQHEPPPPTSNYAAIRFDTEHNPFNSLGTISLDPDDEKNKPHTPIWIPILKWAIIAFVALVLIGAFLLYKRRYS